MAGICQRGCLLSSITLSTLCGHLFTDIKVRPYGVPFNIHIVFTWNHEVVSTCQPKTQVTSHVDRVKTPPVWEKMVQGGVDAPE